MSSTGQSTARQTSRIAQRLEERIGLPPKDDLLAEAIAAMRRSCGIEVASVMQQTAQHKGVDGITLITSEDEIGRFAFRNPNGGSCRVLRPFRRLFPVPIPAS